MLDSYTPAIVSEDAFSGKFFGAILKFACIRSTIERHVTSLATTSNEWTAKAVTTKIGVVLFISK